MELIVAILWTVVLIIDIKHSISNKRQPDWTSIFLPEISLVILLWLYYLKMI